MKRVGIFALCFVFVFLFNFSVVSAQDETFSEADVAERNTPDDCYVIFEGDVYDITDYLVDHEEKFVPIEEWCGTDMTEDFKTKDGEGRDHTGGYNVLADYQIGTLADDPETISEDGDSDDDSDETLVYIAVGGVVVITLAVVGYSFMKR